MDKTKFTFTVFFDGTFYQGIYERDDGRKYEVSRIIFGKEPKDYEIYSFMLRNFVKMKFSPYFTSGETIEKHINPKRMQRLIKKQTLNNGIGTKAQQAIKAMHEQNKISAKKSSRLRKIEKKEQIFIIKQEKKKEKRKGH